MKQLRVKLTVIAEKRIAMKSIRNSIILLCLVPVMGFAAIYKTVDKDGNVVYTDTNPGTQNAEEVELKPITPLPSVSVQYRAPVSQPKETESSDDAYTNLAIINPADGTTVRNAGNFSVTVQTMPRLMSGHRLRLLLDGKPVDKPKRALNFTLLNVDRGSHQLQLDVVNGSNQVVQSTNTTVYVQRAVARSAN